MAQPREVTLPLPLRGLFAPSKSAEVNGMFAGELSNWQSDGVSIETRTPYLVTTERTALQRVPYEFGASARYVLLTPEVAVAGGASLTRAFDGRASHAAISSQVVIADGLGDPFRYTGTSFEPCAFTFTVPDVDAASFDGVVAHQGRLYFWKSNGDLEFYYGGVGAVTGPLERFPLGRLGSITGEMVAAVSLSVDAGQNTNDALCIFTSTGEIVVYGGSNPGDANDWNLITVVKASPPLGRDAFAKVGTDVWMITPMGVISIQKSISEGILALAGAVSAAISAEVLALVRAGQADWQMHTAADGSMVILNRVDAAGARQFCYLTNTKSWFTADYPARKWHNLGGRTEFTEFKTGPYGTALCRLDHSGTSEEPITARWVSSWFAAGWGSSIAYLRPTIIARAPLTVTFTVLSDHNETARDIAEAIQTVTLVPDDDADPGGTVALNDIVACDAVGAEFQLQIEVTAPWAKIVSIKAALQ
jgi:hypothetical protein